MQASSGNHTEEVLEAIMKLNQTVGNTTSLPMKTKEYTEEELWESVFNMNRNGWIREMMGLWIVPMDVLPLADGTRLFATLAKNTELELKVMQSNASTQGAYPVIPLK